MRMDNIMGKIKYNIVKMVFTSGWRSTFQKCVNFLMTNIVLIFHIHELLSFVTPVRSVDLSLFK